MGKIGGILEELESALFYVGMMDEMNWGYRAGEVEDCLIRAKTLTQEVLEVVEMVKRLLEK